MKNNLSKEILASLCLSGILLSVCQAETDSPTEYFFKEEAVMSGEHWLSLPFEITDDGFYELLVEKTGAGPCDILIDGENYPQLKNVSLGINEDNPALPALYLVKGRHSIIFNFSDGIQTADTWKAPGFKQLQNIPDDFIDTSAHWRGLNAYSRILKIGRMFSGNYINVNIARDMAMFSSQGYQYISYYHPQGYLVVGRRKLDANYFEKYWIPVKSSDTLLLDPHNFISMQIDGQGYLHLAYGHHNNALKYIRSVNPYDISKWDTPAGALENASEENNVTYVSFIKLKSGNLLCMFRIGYAGNGYYRLLSYDAGTKKWSRLHSPFITDGGRSSPYFWRPVVAPDGAVHLLWTWRLSKADAKEAHQMLKRYFSGFSNTDICYAKSLDEGKSWLRSDGKAYSLPIERRAVDERRAEVVKTVGVGESFFNHYGSDYDSGGRPHFTFTKWLDQSSRIPQQWHLYHNGDSWESVAVTGYHNRFGWTRAQQSGLASTYLTRPSIVVSSDDTAMIISRSREFFDRLELYLAGPPYRKWTRITGFDGSLGGWEPQMDLDLWHLENKLDLLIVGITDKTAAVFEHKEGLRARLVRALGKYRFWIKTLIRKEPFHIFDYYSNDCSVPVLEIDPELKEDTGYLLEIDYGKMKEINARS